MIIGAIVLLLIVLGVFMLSNTMGVIYDELSKPTEAFLATAKSGDADGAYAMTSIEFQGATGPIAFQNFLDQLYLADYESVSWTGFEKSTNSNYGELGELSGTVTYTGGITKSILVQLVPEDGVWKIQFLSIR